MTNMHVAIVTVMQVSIDYACVDVWAMERFFRVTTCMNCYGVIDLLYSVGPLPGNDPYSHLLSWLHVHIYWHPMSVGGINRRSVISTCSLTRTFLSLGSLKCLMSCGVPPLPLAIYLLIYSVRHRLHMYQAMNQRSTSV